MMMVNIGDKPLAGFSEPIEMLKDCHRRIEHFLDLLCRVAAASDGSALTDDTRRALQAALDYFVDFAPRHTADEEESLFPRLRQSNDAHARAVMADLDRLQQDHRRCEQGHALVDRVGRRWLETGRLDAQQRESLRAAIDELKDIYDAHISLEEQDVFAVAAESLEPAALREIGAEMQARRQATCPGDSDAVRPVDVRR